MSPEPSPWLPRIAGLGAGVLGAVLTLACTQVISSTGAGGSSTSTTTSGDGGATSSTTTSATGTGGMIAGTGGAATGGMGNGGTTAGAGGSGGAGGAIAGTGGSGGAVDPAMVIDFSLVDQNPSSLSYQQPVSPRDYLMRVSAWYFGHAT
jgi:hypothetical protein